MMSPAAALVPVIVVPPFDVAGAAVYDASGERRADREKAEDDESVAKAKHGRFSLCGSAPGGSWNAGRACRLSKERTATAPPTAAISCVVSREV